MRSATVDCAFYEHGRRRSGTVDLDHALEDAAAVEDGFIWIGVHDPTPDVLEQLGEHFDLHPLAVEDAVHAHQRAKLDLYDELLFLVLKTARYVDSEELVEIGELMVFVGPRFVVTVRHGEGSPLGEVRKNLEAHPDLLSVGPSAVLYAIADKVVDDYALVIEGLAVDIDEIEADVFSGEPTNAAQRIYKLKREVIDFRRAVQPLQSPFQRLAARQPDLPVDPRTTEYFRDVQDHLTRDVERIQSFDDLLTNILQANLAQVTVRDNQDLRRISAWVAIVAVPTMVFGLYGMNFEHMPELHWRYGYPAVLLTVALVCAELYRRLKRSGWL